MSRPASESTREAAPGVGRPFVQVHPVLGLEDVRRIEVAVPLAQAQATRSTYDLFRNSAAAFGDRTAIRFLTSADPQAPTVVWSYADLLAAIHRFANLVHGLGVRTDEAVSILMPACPEYHQVLWGGEAAAIVQPLNPLLTDDKLVALMKAARSRVLVAWGGNGDSEYWDKALRLCAKMPDLVALLRVEPHGEPTAPSGQAVPADTPSVTVLELGPACAAQVDDRLISGRRIDPEDIAAYFPTGGTTGDPKLARHSHRAQVFTAWASVQMTGLMAGDSTINGYPLFHVAGVLPASLASLSAGVEVIIPTTTLLRNREVVRNYWRLVERFRPASLSAVPTVLAALADVPLDGADLSSIRYCRTGAAPLSPELAARFERLFGLHVHEALGMTEMAGISTITPPGVVAPAGCVGLRLPHSELRIVALDDQGKAGDRVLPDGEAGMVEFRSPNLFSGFVNPADNLGVLTDDGWLVTGDLGWIDDAGRLNLSGRAKDLIIRSGHNIDPKVIEDALDAHPAVQLAAAVGAPDAYAGEVPVAFATLRPGRQVSETELLAFVGARVDEPPARPKRVTVLEQMPVTNVGKVFKPELRRLAAMAVLSEQIAAIWQAAPPASDPDAVALPVVGAEGADAIRVTLAPGTPQALADRVAEQVARLGLKATVTTSEPSSRLP